MANATTTGTLTLLATLNCISVRAAFTGDDNANNSALLEYKLSAGSVWSTAYTPIIDRRVNVTNGTGGSVSNAANVNQARGSIVGLAENTSYDVRLTWSDADTVSGTNPRTGTISTATRTPLTEGVIREVTNDATLATALAAVNPGDTISLATATYSAFTITRSGSAGNYCKIRPKAANVATISGATNTIDLQADYWWITGLTLGASTSACVKVNGSRSNIYITSNTCANFATAETGAGAVWCSSDVHDLFVLANSWTRTTASTNGPDVRTIQFGGDPNYTIVIDGNTLAGPTWDAVGNGSNSSITNFENVDFSNNTITGFYDDGLELDGAGINQRAWGNTIISGNGLPATGGADCLSDAGLYIGPVYIFRNYCLSAYGYCIKGGHYSFGYVFYFHNTMVCSHSGGGYQVLSQGGGASYSQNHVFRNNIYQSTSNNVWTQEGNRTGNDYDYDVLYRNGGTADVIDSWDTTGAGASVNYATFALFQADNDGAPFAAQEVHGLYGDPGLDASNRIGSGSNANNAGVILNNFNTSDSAWPFSGTAPDIGAFEYQTPVVSTGGGASAVLVAVL